MRTASPRGGRTGGGRAVTAAYRRLTTGQEGDVRSRVQRWGNSLAVRIPSALAREVRLEERAEIDVWVEEGRIVIEPLSLTPVLDGADRRGDAAERARGSRVASGQRAPDRSGGVTSWTSWIPRRGDIIWVRMAMPEACAPTGTAAGVPEGITARAAEGFTTARGRGVAAARPGCVPAAGPGAFAGRLQRQAGPRRGVSDRRRGQGVPVRGRGAAGAPRDGSGPRGPCHQPRLADLRRQACLHGARRGRGRGAGEAAAAGQRAS